MGGTVHAHSGGPGTGATFTVRLPLIAEEAIGKHGVPEALGKTVPALNGLGVLVVEDNADTRQLLTALLEDQGAEVTATASGVARFHSRSACASLPISNTLALPSDGPSNRAQVESVLSVARRHRQPYSHRPCHAKASGAGDFTAVIEELRLLRGEVKALRQDPLARANARIASWEQSAAGRRIAGLNGHGRY